MARTNNNTRNVYKKNQKRKTKLTPLQSAVAVVLLSAVTFAYNFLFPQVVKDYNNTVTVIDVGQAQSNLIESENEFCLIDGGFAKGTEDVYTYLNERGVKKIKLLVISHFHADHTSQLLEVMDNIKIEGILIPALTEKNIPTTSFFKKFLAKVEEKNIPVYTAKQGDEYPVGKGVVKVLMDTPDTNDVNDTSVALSYTMADFVFVYTGDAGVKVEKELIAYAPKNITLFNSGHHGSSTSNLKEFLSALNPKFVAISAGKNNDYGHPHKEVIQTLQELSLQYNITYEEGNLIYSMIDKTLLKESA